MRGEERQKQGSPPVWTPPKASRSVSSYSCLVRVNFKNNIIRSYWEFLMPYVKHFRYRMQALPQAHVSTSETTLNLRRRGDLWRWVFPGCPGCKWTSSSGGLLPCSQCWKMGSRPPRQTDWKTTSPSEGTLLESPTVTRPQAKKAPYFTKVNFNHWELGWFEPSWFVRK